MGFIKLDFTVNAPVEHVWNFGLQADKIPEWQFDVAAVKGISGPIDRKGIKYILVYKKAGILLNSPVEVSRFEQENLTVETSGQTPLGGYFKSRTTMRRINEQMTHVDWVMDYKLPGWVFGVLMDKLLFEWAFRKTVQKYNKNFKMIAEETFLQRQDRGF
ncbi:MAG TPA: SRPBCC family protein [Clostridiales bacterium]|nr:SRPBCC family protein [Clostridiales bacterium]